MKTKSNGPTPSASRAGSASSAGPTRRSTLSASPAAGDVRACDLGVLGIRLERDQAGRHPAAPEPARSCCSRPASRTPAPSAPQSTAPGSPAAAPAAAKPGSPAAQRHRRLSKPPRAPRHCGASNPLTYSSTSAHRSDPHDAAILDDRASDAGEAEGLPPHAALVRPYSSSCQGVRIRGPSAVTAIVNSKWAAREPSWE